MHISNSPFLVYNASAGSGKTYTLVKNYLKILLNTSNPFQFQQVLAMTFTNKAAAEMKTRILETLDKLQQGEFTDSMFLDIKNELNLSNEVLQKRAKNSYKNILNQYAGFHITTIDSFTYKLIKSFAFDLGLSMDFEVEMDPVNLINQAIDVLFSKIGIEKELSKTLIDFAKEKANEDKDWNIEKELQDIAKLLLKEADVQNLNKLKDKKIGDFKTLDSLLYKRIKTFEKKAVAIANQAFAVINQTDLIKADFVRGGFYSFFTHLKNLNFKDVKLDKTLEKNIQKDHHQCSGKASKEAITTMQEIKPQLIALYEKTKLLFKADYPNYVLDTLVKKSLIPLSVLKSIQQILNEIKTDNNIMFNSEFNQIIHTHLSEQPAAFIYEKIGEKFRHYFIDEMQDTSVLQWHNSIPLIKNALESENEKGEKGSLLLVGDAKQSIYRWRGSKPEQFINLTLDKNLFFVAKKVATLDTNFRSHEKIITFNNEFFQFVGKHLQNETYKKLYIDGNKQKTNQKKGGYVEITLLEDVKNNEE
jgi:ATP-dependent exoDNAse (exonuclease V) beta subunit